MARKIIRTQEQAPTTNTAATPTQPVQVDGYIVTRTLEVANPKVWGDQKVSLTVAIDFTGVELQQILEWASRTKAIDLQRALRACELGYIKSIAARGTLHRKATECGIGFADPAKQMAQVTAAIGTMSAEQKAALLKLLQG